MTQLALQLLGGFGLRDAAGQEIRVPSRKGRALLAYLAMHAGQSIGRDRLAALLWEEADDELARSSLRQALAALRRLLPACAQAALVADTGAVRLDAGLIDTDVASLRRCLAASTRAALQDSLTHHRGEVLEGFDARSAAFDEWLQQERLAVRRQMVETAQKLAALCDAQGDLDSALAACNRVVVLEPLNEAAHRQLMDLHARRNSYAAALRQYQVCRDNLRRELDVAPEPATENLYRELLRRRRASGSEPIAGDQDSDPEGRRGPCRREAQ